MESLEKRIRETKIDIENADLRHENAKKAYRDLKRLKAPEKALDDAEREMDRWEAKLDRYLNRKRDLYKEYDEEKKTRGTRHESTRYDAYDSDTGYHSSTARPTASTARARAPTGASSAYTRTEVSPSGTRRRTTHTTYRYPRDSEPQTSGPSFNPSFPEHEARDRARSSAHPPPRKDTRSRAGTSSYAESSRAAPSSRHPEAPTLNTALPSRYSSSVVAAWKSECQKAFANPAGMRAFPEPPAIACPCNSRTCHADRKVRSLQPCKCSLQKLFSREFFPNGLKSERLKWHPDRFTAVPKGIRADVQRKAGEVFAVVNEMHDREK